MQIPAIESTLVAALVGGAGASAQTLPGPGKPTIALVHGAFADSSNWAPIIAGRAQARKAVVVEGASHALMLSHPDQVVALIEDAASAR